MREAMKKPQLSKIVSISERAGAMPKTSATTRDWENTIKKRESGNGHTCGMAKWVNARSAFSVYDKVLQGRLRTALAKPATYPAKLRVIGDMST
jgi:hypothetical protein